APLSNRAFAFLLPEGVGSSMSKDIALSRYFLTSNPRAAAARMTWGSSFFFCLVCRLVLRRRTVKRLVTHLVTGVALVRGRSLSLMPTGRVILWLVIWPRP